MTWSAGVLTAWTGSATSLADAHRPQLLDDYDILRFEDITRQDAQNLQPDPNLYLIQVECEADVLGAIEADADYLVLWSEEIAEEML